MIINHIVQRREERRQRKARWMLSRCFTQEVQITDIIIEEPIVIKEPIALEEEAIVIQVHSTSNMSSDMEVEPIVIVEKAIVSTKHIDEAAEELRKLLILHQTIKKLSSKKKVI